MDLKELESGVNPEVHWYYQSKMIPLFSYVKKLVNKVDGITLVDVGSGSGFFAISLEKRYPSLIKKVYLVDIGYTSQEIAVTKNQKIEKTLRIPDKIENGLVILMDVLEHLESDLKMLQEIKSACVGNSNRFFITVPAFMSLWSGHDVFLGHYRRYKINSLRSVLNQADFKIGACYYIYGALFPMVWLVRQINKLTSKEAKSNMKPSGNLVNSLLLNFNAVEMKVAKINKMFGVTCVAEGEI